MTSGCVIVATIFIRREHLGHSSTSDPKTRFMSSAQESRREASSAVSSASQPSWLPSARRPAGPAGTTRARSFERGASVPW